MTRTRIRRVPLALAGVAAASLLAIPSRAGAQIPTVTPDGSLADPAAPPPAPPPTPIIVTPQGGPATPATPETTSGGGASRGYYHSDEVGSAIAEQEREAAAAPVAPGTVPAVHTVRTGDTLWDLCFSYFNNPWEWPRVWSYNPEITNPHWIYPGDQVRLRAAGAAPAAPDKSAPASQPSPVAVTPARAGFFELRQLAFVASEDLALGITIDGAPEEKMLLASGDEVYLAYPEDKPPRVGKRYAIYLERERVRHPTRNEEVGAYVRVVGEVEVISAARGKRARGILLDSVDAIERGMKVGPLVRQFRDVEPAAAQTDLEATIVAEIGAEELIGARQVVFIDRGSEHKLRAGNRMHVVRRGDAYEVVMQPQGNIGKNDQRFPARSVGEILVVQTGKRSAVAVVVQSDRELGVGDRVLMSRAQDRRR
jgi:LysM domain